MINPVVKSKLSHSQIVELERIEESSPEIRIDRLAQLIAEEVFDRGLVVPALVEAVKLIGPLACDQGRNIWHYANGVWLSDGYQELSRRVQLCTGNRFRKDHVAQAVAVISTQEIEIRGLGSSQFINVKNGMLDWKTLELHSHSPIYFSTYQLDINWNPDALCPTIDKWMHDCFDASLHSLLWQIMGIVWHPGEGFQKAITLIGSGYNGKGTFLRLCLAGLPSTAYCAIDPKRIAENRFAAAELFGKTANVVGDIERFTFNSTAEFKKITGHDLMPAERKMGQPFQFMSQATNLFAGNKMPPSRDTSEGWHRRWLIVPMERRISGRPDPDLEERLHAELEGALVRAVHGLRIAKENGGFIEPLAVIEAQKEYEYSNNTSALFISKQLEFSPKFQIPVTRSTLLGSYTTFCEVRRLETDSRNKFYEMLEELGTPHLKDHWIGSERGYLGVRYTGS